jgi:hypothetical protein
VNSTFVRRSLAELLRDAGELDEDLDVSLQWCPSI